VNRKILFSQIAVCFALSFFLAGCGEKVSAKQDTGDTAPPPAQVEPDMDASNFKVDRPQDFPVVAAASHFAAPELNVTGVVGADPSRQVPVISTATGRVVEINARIGDDAKQGQILFKVRSTDIAGAFSDYRKAVQTELLMKRQLDRAQILLKDGAIPTSALEIAQTNEDNAVVDVQTTTQHLQTLGADPTHPADIVEMHAPVSGVITDQQITNAAAVQAYAPPYAFTISDMSHVWIVCDVFENNLAQVHLADFVDVRLNAYPDRVFKARVANIGQIMDPNLHTAKVRLEVENPGVMRLGMFVTATFHGDKAENHAVVPSSAILHLHDRDWIYTPGADNHFKRVEVVAGPMLSDKTSSNTMQEIISGIKPGDRVVSNALVLQSTVEQ
jgi:cobalt-zinc-cadmium efflux system membrane fusion protein